MAFVAGAALPVAAGAVREARDFAGSVTVDKILDWMVKLGVALLGAGGLMSLAGYFLKVQSGRALNDAGTVIANIAAIFSNVKYDPPQSPYKSVTTSNPLNDVVNFANDVWSGAQNTFSDVASGLGAVTTALEDLPKAIYQTFIHIPELFWDTAVGGLGGAVADVFIWLFPYLMVFGVILLVAGLILKWAWPRAKAAGAGVEGAVEDRWTYELDRRGWHPFLALEARIRGPAPHHAPGESSVGGPTGGVPQGLPGPVGAPGAVPAAVPPPPEPAPIPEVVQPHPTQTNALAAPPDEPISDDEPKKGYSGTTPTEEAEAKLGDDYTAAKDRMRAALRSRGTSVPAGA